jgi:hypothetical protein
MTGIVTGTKASRMDDELNDQIPLERSAGIFINALNLATLAQPLMDRASSAQF